MAGFNSVKHRGPNAVTYEGGKAYERDAFDSWINMLFSSFLEDGFYETKETQRTRFLELTDKILEDYGPEFLAKAACFTRNVLGLRSISQLLAAYMNDKSFENKRAFYKCFMRRPDDVAEIFAAIDFLDQKRSHALIRGAADYLSTLRPETIAKYKLNSRTYNMFDLINLTHAHSKAIDQYKQGTLAPADTWEVKISGAEDSVTRNQEWKRLVEDRKLGYMALIRNLNNILALGESGEIDANWVNTYLIPQITDEYAIRASLMFPYRFYTAYKNLKVTNTAIIAALEQAFIYASQLNMPTFEGMSGVILDVSGSMTASLSNRSNINILEAGACFAVALCIGNPEVKIVKFGNHAGLFKFNALETPFENIRRLCLNEGLGYGTYIKPALTLLDKETTWDDLKRVFLISDMQVLDPSWDYQESASHFYITRFGNIPCYSFDLGHYPTQILPPARNLHFITTFNDNVFKFIKYLEMDGELFKYINSYSYC